MLAQHLFERGLTTPSQVPASLRIRPPHSCHCSMNVSAAVPVVLLPQEKRWKVLHLQLHASNTTAITVRWAKFIWSCFVLFLGKFEAPQPCYDKEHSVIWKVLKIPQVCLGSLGMVDESTTSVKFWFLIPRELTAAANLARIPLSPRCFSLKSLKKIS